MKRIAILVTMMLSMLIIDAQVNLTLGLRAYYPFDGNANDMSGNANNPISNNATLTADRLGAANSAYHFNGTSNFIRVANSASLNMTTQMSIAVWIKPLGFYAGSCHGNSVVIKGDDAFPTGRYALRYDDGQFLNSNNCSVPSPDVAHENYWGVGAYQNGGYTPYVATNQWASVIYTYDGTTGRIYINCQLAQQVVSPVSTFTTASDLFIGTTPDGTFPYWLNADLDEVRIYNRALNTDEVNALGGCTILPVKWVNIEAKKSGTDNVVTWTTTSETEELNYQVQKSLDGTSWVNTGSPLPAHNASGIQDYTYNDPTNNSPITYYRILQTDINGRKSYSSVVFLKQANDKSVTIYPNPAKDNLAITIGNSRNNIQSVDVYSLTGQRVLSVPSINSRQYLMDISQLTTGNYKMIIRLVNGDFASKSFNKQ